MVELEGVDTVGTLMPACDDEERRGQSIFHDTERRVRLTFLQTKATEGLWTAYRVTTSMILESSSAADLQARRRAGMLKKRSSTCQSYVA